MSESGKIEKTIIRASQQIAQTHATLRMHKGVNMATAQLLNKQFGIDGQLNFREDASGLIIAEINNEMATASVCLQGAHLMSWRPKSQAVPVVWLSRDAKLAVGKSIRGGAPVCWPWFGAHTSESGFPGHGFARTVPWQVVESGSEPDSATRITLRLAEIEKTRAQWPHDSRLDLTFYFFSPSASRRCAGQICSTC